ncbi:MAG: hypothetical protein ACLP4V_12060 [Methylocella sp.]
MRTNLLIVAALFTAIGTAARADVSEKTLAGLELDYATVGFADVACPGLKMTDRFAAVVTALQASEEQRAEIIKEGPRLTKVAADAYRADPDGWCKLAFENYGPGGQLGDSYLITSGATLAPLEDTTCLRAHFSDSTVAVWQEDILKAIGHVRQEKLSADMRPAFESVCRARYGDLEARKAMRDLGISDEDIGSKDIPILVLMEARALFR